MDRMKIIVLRSVIFLSQPVDGSISDEFSPDDPYDWTLPTIDGPKFDAQGVSVSNGGRYLMVSKRDVTSSSGENSNYDSYDSNYDNNDSKYEKVAILLSPSPGYISTYKSCRLEFQVYDRMMR